MILKAFDLLREIGWEIIDFIFSLIDVLFEILKEVNSYNIVDSLANNNLFKSFHTGVITIALTLIALFIMWKFISKLLEPDEGLSTSQIVNDSAKCICMILLSTFLFSQVSTFSIMLSGYTANIFDSNNVTISDSMLSLYVTHTDGYIASEDYKTEDISVYIGNDSFTTKKIYNYKYVTDSNWILPDEEDYKYSVNWIMAFLVGGFFLYALFFSGMMLARRQIEFLFLFTISPIVFATSVGNKQRRGALFEQLVSLVLQSAVIMLIISITALVMQSVNVTTFFADSTFKDVVVKSLMFLGAATFLLTGSQVVNRFIGGNVSANSGRDQLMSLMGFGSFAGGSSVATGLTALGLGKVGAGAVTKGIAGISSGGAGVKSKAGSTISKFGESISSLGSKSGSESSLSKLGNSISSYGKGMENKANNKLFNTSENGKRSPTLSNKIGSIGSNMMRSGSSDISSAINTITPTRNYRNRYRSKGD